MRLVSSLLTNFVAIQSAEAFCQIASEFPRRLRGKVSAHFDKKLPHIVNQRPLKFLFQVFFCHLQEVKGVFILHRQFA